MLVEMISLDSKIINTIKDAARKLTSEKRRAFQAQVTHDYCQSRSRKAEIMFGWNRDNVQVGINELRTGIICYANFSARGRRRSEDLDQKLKEDIISIADPESQADPQFRSSNVYLKITSSSLRKRLINEKKWDESKIPCTRSLRDILNRMGYKLKRVQKKTAQKSEA